MADTHLPSLTTDHTAVNHGLEETSHEPKRAQIRSQPETSDAARTSRLTENKRRYRARQKEYVADLERRLGEARAQGITATAQVQLAARQVVAENGRLRELLHLAGFDNEDIDVWAKRDRCANAAEGADCARRRNIERRARLCATVSADPQSLGPERIGASTKCNSKRAIGAAGNTPESINTPSPANEQVVAPGVHTITDLDGQAEMAIPATTSESEASTDTAMQTGSCATRSAGLGPCKLLSRLADNPHSDITQVTASRGPAVDLIGERLAEREGGVECKEAYEMLMRYATSEEKMDYVARALETGCTSNGQGGCAVKKQVIWEALDGMCR